MPKRRDAAGQGMRWVVAHAIAGCLIGFLEGGRFPFLATLVLSGLIIGLFQWLVLRRWWSVTWVWIPITFGGWLVGMQGAIALAPLLHPLANRLAAWVGWEVFWLQTLQQPVVLGVLGSLQSILLRRSPLSARWVFGSALGGLARGMVSTSVCAIACVMLSHWGGSALATAITDGTGWLAYGIVTGFEVFRQFRQQSSGEGLPSRRF